MAALKRRPGVFLATVIPLGAAETMALIEGGFYTLRSWRLPAPKRRS